LFFLAKAKDGDYHQEMNARTFLNWFENQLMPALKRPSVIVLDTASYHNIKTEETVVKSHLSIKPSSRLPACKTINLLPFPEGIFGASEPSTGNHM
jgi:transposase